ncbi:MAG: hypothetical protein JJU05_16335 [Verrucomicrobia bacterium]|nr:hypothetical protein [Verrucomicrobiota bacterium]MCH8529126.1 hypothetical protein [Kiritimatiellia bacterium]
MKSFLSFLFLGWAFFLTGCASDPRPLPVPPQWEEPEPQEEEPVVEEAGEVPDLAEGVRLFHEDQEVSMEALARGRVPEGGLIQIAARPDVRHSAVSETLIQLHSMGFLVGIRTERPEGEREQGTGE